LFLFCVPKKIATWKKGARSYNTKFGENQEKRSNTIDVQLLFAVKQK
jgi:hypothetical protein